MRQNFSFCHGLYLYDHIQTRILSNFNLFCKSFSAEDTPNLLNSIPGRKKSCIMYAYFICCMSVTLELESYLPIFEPNYSENHFHEVTAKIRIHVELPSVNKSTVLTLTWIGPQLFVYKLQIHKVRDKHN